jgi:hypothetical protein
MIEESHGGADPLGEKFRASSPSGGMLEKTVRLAVQQQAISEDPMPRYKCKSIAALHIALGGLPAKMQVEADVGTRVSAKTVGELRKVTTWSENLAITIPPERHSESAVKISKAGVATRTSPKP